MGKGRGLDIDYEEVATTTIPTNRATTSMVMDSPATTIKMTLPEIVVPVWEQFAAHAACWTAASDSK